MPSPIIARADALMQRRQYGQTAADDFPVLTEAIGDDGIPLLLNTDAPQAPIESLADAVPTTFPTLPQEAPPTFDAGERERLIRELSGRIEQRLLSQLPEIIEATVRDFLAEQERPR